MGNVDALTEGMKLEVYDAAYARGRRDMQRDIMVELNDAIHFARMKEPHRVYGRHRHQVWRATMDVLIGMARRVNGLT